MTAINVGGESGKSAEISVTPLAPALPTVTSTSSSATVNWSAVTGAVSYKIFRSTTPGGEGTTAFQSGLTATSFNDTSVINGTKYYYTVSAVNPTAQSNQSQEVVAAPVAAPTVPVAGAGNAHVLVSWNAVSGATSYRLYRSLTSGGEGATAYRSNILTNSFDDVGLANNIAYYYQVTAVSSTGESLKSIETFATPNVATSAGLYINGISETNAASSAALRTGLRKGNAIYSDSAVTYSRVAGANVNLALDDYVQFANADRTVGNYSFSYTLSQPATVYLLIDKRNLGLPLPTGATGFVDAHDYVGSTTQNFEVFQKVQSAGVYTLSGQVNVNGFYALAAGPTPPAAPSNLSAVAVAGGHATLTWNDNSNNESVFYFDRSSDPSFSQFVTVDAPAGTGSTASVTDFAILSGATVYYRVRAVNSTGTSTYSNTAVVTIPPANQPLALVATPGPAAAPAGQMVVGGSTSSTTTSTSSAVASLLSSDQKTLLG